MSDLPANGLPEGFEVDDSEQLSWSYLIKGICDSSVWRMGSESKDHSVRQQSKDVRILWVAMLSERDRHGNVFTKGLPGLAGRANLTIKETQNALRILMEPDEFSSTKIMDGRRVIEIPRGWRIVTTEIYNERIKQQIRRAQKAKWEREHYVSKKQDKNLDKNLDNSGQAWTSLDIDQSSLTLTDTLTLTMLSAKADMPICPKRDGKEKPKPLDADLEAQLSEELKDLFGEQDWKQFGGIWTLRWRENLTKLRRVLAEVESMRRNSKIHISIGGTANDLWKRFAPKTIW